MEKTLHNSTVSGAHQNVADLQVVGNGDLFQLLCKASSQAEGWMKSTKAMQVPGGCIVQVTTQQRNPDGSYAVAEALTFVPGVLIVDDVNNGRRLDSSESSKLSETLPVLTTFQQYLEANTNHDGCEFRLVVKNCPDETTRPEFYIHPLNRDGDTLDYKVSGNSLECTTRVIQ